MSFLAAGFVYGQNDYHHEFDHCNNRTAHPSRPHGGWAEDDQALIWFTTTLTGTLTRRYQIAGKAKISLTATEDNVNQFSLELGKIDNW